MAYSCCFSCNSFFTALGVISFLERKSTDLKMGVFEGVQIGCGLVSFFKNEIISSTTSPKTSIITISFSNGSIL